MSTFDHPRIKPRTIAVIAATLLLLVGARIYNYALFHTIAEMFAVTVAVSAFMVMWNTRRYIEDNYLLIIGISFAFIACLDVMHLLTFKGMGLFPGLSADPPTQFWIAGRALQAGVFLIAPSFVHRRPRVRTWFIWLSVVTAALAASIVVGIFPSCLGPDGLTPFKILAEVVIIIVLIGAYTRLRLHSERFDPETLRLVSAAIIITAISEVTFTLYRDPFALMNFIGHFLRILAFFLLYRATVVKALTEPYAVLFRQLAQSADALTQSERQLRRAKGFSDAMTVIDSQINSTLDLDEVMRRVIVESARTMGADSASISLREGSSWVIAHTYRLPESLTGARFGDDLGRHLVAAASAKTPLLIDDALHSAVVNPEFAAAYGIRSLLSVPLSHTTDVIGIMTFHKHRDDDHFAPEAIEFAGRLAHSLALAIRNVRLYSAQRALADTLQRPMLALPKTLRGARLAHAYRSADEIALIGGDFYDALQLESGHVVFFVGDVSGKGIEAATASSMVRTTLRAFAYHEEGPAAVLSEANRALHNMFTDEKYATVTVGMLDPATGELKLSSAGHPDPYLCSPRGCIRHVAERDVPLGLFADTRFSQSRILLEADQTILLYSDGLLDTRRGKEFFGESRVSALLEDLATEDPEAIVNGLIEATERFAGSQFTDDIALMALRYVPETP